MKLQIQEKISSLLSREDYLKIEIISELLN